MYLHIYKELVTQVSLNYMHAFKGREYTSCNWSVRSIKTRQAKKLLCLNVGLWPLLYVIIA